MLKTDGYIFNKKKMEIIGKIGHSNKNFSKRCFIAEIA